MDKFSTRSSQRDFRGSSHSSTWSTPPLTKRNTSSFHAAFSWIKSGRCIYQRRCMYDGGPATGPVRYSPQQVRSPRDVEQQYSIVPDLWQQSYPMLISVYSPEDAMVAFLCSRVFSCLPPWKMVAPCHPRRCAVTDSVSIVQSSNHQIQTPVLANLHTACVRRNKTIAIQASRSVHNQNCDHNQHPAIS